MERSFVACEGSTSDYSPYTLKSDACMYGHEKGSLIVIGEYAIPIDTSHLYYNSLYQEHPELYEGILPEDYFTKAE